MQLVSRLEAIVNQRPPGDKSNVVAFALDVGDAEGNEIIAFRHRPFHAVKPLRFDEEDRVVVADGRLEHALGIAGRRRINHVKTGDVTKNGFERLRMLAAVTLAGAGGGADDQRHFGLRAAHVMPFGRLVADLIR